MLIEHHHHHRRPAAAPTSSHNRIGDEQQQPQEAGSKFSSVCSFQDTNLSELRRGRRIHGLQLPLHPLQLIAWVTLLIFALATFLVVIPALKPPLHNYVFALLAGLFVVHVTSHLVALLLDPSDKELRRQHKSDRIVPEFDRVKHRHVIENSRCHLCNIKTSSPRTKHCSVCNKCVGNFDHHCKWLNHCIGSRNYTSFLLCVFSSVLATVTIAGIVITEITLYYVSPQSLNLWTETVTLTRFFEGGGERFGATPFVNGSMSITNNDDNSSLLLLVPGGGGAEGGDSNATALDLNNSATGVFAVEDTLFLVFISVVGVLATVTAALLIHLCFFHMYISFLGITTYEYIRNQRQQSQDGQESQRPPPPSEVPSNRSESQAAVVSIDSEFENGGEIGGSKKKSSIDRIFFCSAVLNKNRFRSGGTKFSRPFRYFIDNKVADAAATTSTTAVATEEHAESSENALKSMSQCVVCSLMEIDPIQGNNLLCCTKVYGHHQQHHLNQGNIKLGHDVDPEEAIVTDINPVATTSKNMIPPIIPNKSQRWCSKLYCCVNVPDSPEMHIDVCNTLSNIRGSTSHNANRETSEAASTASNVPRITHSNVFKITVTEDKDRTNQKPTIRPISRRIGPVRKYNRIRRLLRMVKMNKQKKVNEGIVHGPVPKDNNPGKVNQIRPLSISSTVSAAPPSPNTTLAPSPRRKLRPRADLKGYIEYLSSSEQHSQPSVDTSTSFSPPLNNKADQSLFTRRTRKKMFRNHSPKLSPIKESGLSNPASPAPTRNQLFPTIT